MSRKKVYGGVEAGGTKFYCAVGTGPDDLEMSDPIPTRNPEETLADVISFFAGRRVERLGIASFGPVELKRGVISKTTPKLNWRGVPIRQILGKALDVDVVIDTDVNGAALSEQQWGAAQDYKDFVYITVGTGIGGGAMSGGKLVHGDFHTEMGHLRVPRQAGDKFPGSCPLHRDCWEGLASGTAVAQRTRGGKAMDYDLEAQYLALGIINIHAVLSPELIVIGGGVMKERGLLDNVRLRVSKELAGYLPEPKIVRPKLGNRSGVLGGIALAQAED